ncbi:MAG: hypothetical protein QM648_02575 [Solirubrobacterales bacterium]
MSDESQGVGSRIAGAEPLIGNRREVMVIGRHAPASASETRWDHIVNLAGARRYILPTAVIGGVLFLLGATTGNAIVAFVPLLIVVGISFALIWNEATAAALSDFLAGYALERQFDYSDQMGLIGATPLLAAGDRRRCEHYMEGSLDDADDVSVAMAHFIVETQEQRSDRRNRPISVFRPHDFTIAVVEIPRAATVLPGVFLGQAGGKHKWLTDPKLIPAPVIDSALRGRSELWIRSDVDRSRLDELMASSFQTWLVAEPLKVLFEYDSGMLVVYVPRRLKSADDLDALLAATRRIAKQIGSSGEPLQAVAPIDSKAPPQGVAAFPPPPPATKPRLEPRLVVAPEVPIEEPSAPTYTRASTPPPAS